MAEQARTQARTPADKFHISTLTTCMGDCFLRLSLARPGNGSEGPRHKGSLVFQFRDSGWKPQMRRETNVRAQSRGGASQAGGMYLHVIALTMARRCQLVSS